MFRLSLKLLPILTVLVGLVITSALFIGQSIATTTVSVIIDGRGDDPFVLEQTDLERMLQTRFVFDDPNITVAQYDFTDQQYAYAFTEFTEPGYEATTTVYNLYRYDITNGDRTRLFGGVSDHRWNTNFGNNGILFANLLDGDMLMVDPLSYHMLRYDMATGTTYTLYRADGDPITLGRNRSFYMYSPGTHFYYLQANYVLASYDLETDTWTEHPDIAFTEASLNVRFLDDGAQLLLSNFNDVRPIYYLDTATMTPVSPYIDGLAGSGARLDPECHMMTYATDHESTGILQDLRVLDLNTGENWSLVELMDETYLSPWALVMVPDCQHVAYLDGRTETGTITWSLHHIDIYTGESRTIIEDRTNAAGFGPNLYASEWIPYSELSEDGSVKRMQFALATGEIRQIDKLPVISNFSSYWGTVGDWHVVITESSSQRDAILIHQDTHEQFTLIDNDHGFPNFARFED